MSCVAKGSNLSKLLDFSYRDKLLVTVLIVCCYGQSDGKGMCGNIFYNTSQSICCGSKLIDRVQEGVVMACCNVSGNYHTYRKNTEICCGNQVGVAKSYVYQGKTLELTCCPDGKIAEPHKNETCCASGRVTKKKDSDVCCGSELYDLEAQTCCENVHDRTYKIYEGARNDWQKCCGTNLYNLDDGTSCDKHTQKLYGEKFRPCGEQKYDPNLEICCYEGNVMTKPISKQSLPRFAMLPNYQCREGQIYDSNIYDFIPTYSPRNITALLVPKGYESCENKPYNPHETRFQQFCCDNHLRNASLGHRLACCGTELYDKDKEDCCEDKIISGSLKCCGNTIYNASSPSSCCNRKIITEGKEVCCEDRISINAKVPNHTLCCRLRSGLYDSYNYYNEVCRKGKIVNKSDLRRESTPPKCPYCGRQKELQTFNTMDRRREYRVVLEDFERTQRGTKIMVRFLYPLSVRPKPMTIFIKFRCICFKKGKRYTIFTNRNLGKPLKKKGRLSTKDMLIRNTLKNREIIEKNQKLVSIRKSMRKFS